MTKVISSLVLSIALIISGYFISNSLYKAKLLDRTVTVKGLSERVVDADLAVWELQINLTDNILIHLNKTIKAQRKDLYKFLLEIGYKENEISLGSINIKDLKSDPYLNNKKVAYNYRAVANILIRTNDINKIQNSMDKVVGFSKNNVLISSKSPWNPVNYYFTKLSDIKPEMVKEATKNAKKVAQEFANDSESSLGKIKNAKQGVFSITNRDNSTPQIKKIRVVTTITYTLED